MIPRFRSSAGSNSLRHFLQDERGSATIEFVLMVPLFAALVLLVTDASLLFLRQTTLMNISRDTARIVSRHAMTPIEAQDYARRAAQTKVSTATANVTIANGVVTVVLTSSAGASAPFGMVEFAVGDTLTAVAISTMEPI